MDPTLSRIPHPLGTTLFALEPEILNNYMYTYIYIICNNYTTMANEGLMNEYPEPEGDLYST